MIVAFLIWTGQMQWTPRGVNCEYYDDTTIEISIDYVDMCPMEIPIHGL